MFICPAVLRRSEDGGPDPPPREHPLHLPPLLPPHILPRLRQDLQTGGQNCSVWPKTNEIKF